MFAEVDVELLEDETGWSPYISLEDAYKLDDVRDALRRRDRGVGGEIWANLRTTSNRTALMAKQAHPRRRQKTARQRICIWGN